MPNCFSLTKKGEKEITKLTKVDEEIADLLGLPCDPEKWTVGWYDTIGLGLAMGKNWNDLRKWWPKEDPKYANSPAHAVIDYLEANYNVDAWYECGRR